MTILILIMAINTGEKAILGGEPPLRFVVLMCSLRDGVGIASLCGSVSGLFCDDGFKLCAQRAILHYAVY